MSRPEWMLGALGILFAALLLALQPARARTVTPAPPSPAAAASPIRGPVEEAAADRPAQDVHSNHLRDDLLYLLYFNQPWRVYAAAESFWTVFLPGTPENTNLVLRDGSVAPVLPVRYACILAVLNLVLWGGLWLARNAAGRRALRQ